MTIYITLQHEISIKHNKMNVWVLISTWIIGVSIFPPIMEPLRGILGVKSILESSCSRSGTLYFGSGSKSDLSLILYNISQVIERLN